MKHFVHSLSQIVYSSMFTKVIKLTLKPAEYFLLRDHQSPPWSTYSVFTGTVGTWLEWSSTVPGIKEPPEKDLTSPPHNCPLIHAHKIRAFPTSREWQIHASFPLDLCCVFWDLTNKINCFCSWSRSTDTGLETLAHSAAILNLSPR